MPRILQRQSGWLSQRQALSVLLTDSLWRHKRLAGSQTSLYPSVLGKMLGSGSLASG
tara:strand:- start:246 stop:416 length:171 start_codon:yes stop_codon:yes gene_type:complete